MSYHPFSMPLDYMRLLRELVEERESWVRKRDDVERELSRLSELIRSTIKMLPADRRLQCEYDELVERVDNRPRGLTFLIRSAFTAGKEWLTPIEIRDYLKGNGFNFEKYKANPLASIHTTLKRMVPHEVECKTVDGQKIYRLKTAGQWMSSFTEAREWVNELRKTHPDKKFIALSATANRPRAALPLDNSTAKSTRPRRKHSSLGKQINKEQR